MSNSAAAPAHGNFFEDFSVGQHFVHATPRTVTCGDRALYIALTGARQPLASSQSLAMEMGHSAMPLDDAMVFNIAFGKTVPDISANAVANLGYADVRFCRPVCSGDTIRAESEVIGVRETTGGKAGIVYVRSVAFNQSGEMVLSWVRWVLVRKRDPSAPPPEAVVPALPAQADPAAIAAPPACDDPAPLLTATGSDKLWEDYSPGMRIEHPAGMTLDEPDHTFATRLYQNTARVHFDARAMRDTPHGRRLVYGGHVISVCRALSYDGLENVLSIASINGGTHAKPTFAGDTLYALTEVLEATEFPGREDIGCLRLRLLGLKNAPSAGFSPDIESDGKSRLDEAVVLDLDHTVIIPRRGAVTGLE